MITLLWTGKGKYFVSLLIWRQNHTLSIYVCECIEGTVSLNSNLLSKCHRPVWQSKVCHLSSQTDVGEELSPVINWERKSDAMSKWCFHNNYTLFSWFCKIIIISYFIRISTFAQHIHLFDFIPGCVHGYIYIYIYIYARING